MSKMKPLDYASITLLIIGGLNWGLVGLTNFKYNLVQMLFGWAGRFITNSVYVLVGIAALYSIYRFTLGK